ncbi:sensor histidine kinase [Zobellella iuensis]|uniref:histidine kinase n=1 Tax=Zobellella iuensis TaxID=2803811 RepID=A0ABS1QMX9_9GAMM|nr:CHASE3 domain-containing protein [Zobellella iuensis]MBL1376200.1 CHASE3 domain-containing protein [Zobellella iuensis]
MPLLLNRETAPQVLAFFFSLVILLLIMLEGDRTNRELLRLNDAVVDIHEGISSLQELQALLLDVETGERGYLLTGNEEYLAPYHQALALIDERYRRTEERMAAEPAQQDRLARLEELIARKLGIATRNVEIRRQQGLAEARERLLSGEGKQVMDAIRGLMTEMEAHGRMLLLSSTREAHSQAARSRWFTLGGGSIAVLLLLLVALVLNRDFRARGQVARQARASAARLQALLDAVPESLFRLRPGQVPEYLGGAVDAHRMMPATVLVAALEHGEHDGQAHSRDWIDEETGRCYEIRVAEVEGQEQESLAMVREVTEQRRVAQMKHEFIATVSHELRTPLTSLNGALALLAVNEGAGVNPDLRPMLRLALKNSERLVVLIRDILDVERLDNGRLLARLKRQPIRHLVSRSLEDNLPFAERFGVHLLLAPQTEDAEVNVDADRFLQVMANLISNAIKFSPPGEAVRIGIERQPTRVLIWVADHGPGIPKSFHDRMFERFSQADSSDSRQKGGAGLGLYISKGLMEQMEGSIGFVSEEGVGTTFYLYLPLVEP